MGGAWLLAPAALGVTDPYSAGVGGGGFFVVYDAGTGAVSTIDGRETAPASADEVLFVEDGEPIPFDEAVTSGLSLGVPGTPLTWQRALDQWGTWELREALGPAEQLARRGFVVDETFAGQTADNAERFADFPATGELFLPGGAPPEVGELFRNPDLARTYRELGRDGVDVFSGNESGQQGRCRERLSSCSGEVRPSLALAQVRSSSSSSSVSKIPSYASSSTGTDRLDVLLPEQRLQQRRLLQALPSGGASVPYLLPYSGA